LKKDTTSSEELAEQIVAGAQERKGKDIILLDLRKINNAVTDFFVICHGDSNTHVTAIAESIEEEVRKHINDKPWHTEGQENAEWILLDYVNVVAHVFQKDIREFYSLEELWADAKRKEFESIF